MNIVLTPGVWVDIYTTTGIAVGTQLEVANLTPNSVRLSSTVAEPVQADNHFPSLYGRGSVRNTHGDPGAWAMCVAGGAIDVFDLSNESSWSNVTLSPSSGLLELGPGEEFGFIVASGNRVMSTVSSTIWDYGGNYPYMSGNTQLYVSSSSVLDVGNLIVNQGMTDDYVRATATAIINGHTQVALSDELFKVFASINGTAPGLMGDVYIAEADTLTNGVPDTPSKVKNMIPRSTDSQGVIIDDGTDYASDNISHLGLYTVPAGFTYRAIDIFTGTPKNDDVKLGGRIRLPGGPWLQRNPAFIYQSDARLNFNGVLDIPEKTDFEVRAIAGSDNSGAQFQFFFKLIPMVGV